MALPIDLSAVLKAATNTQEEAHAPVAASVYVDGSAPAECIAHVRGLFAAAGENARVSITYMDKGVDPQPEDDMAVIVAGLSTQVGAVAEQLRNAGVPVMVATVLPELVAALAHEEAHPIPAGDIVAPVKPARRIFRGKDVPAEAETDEPLELNDERTRLFDSRMGEWILAACPDRKLAFAHAFPFVRRPLAMDAIAATSLQNAGIGLMPIIPGADMPIMTLNQAKMLMQIAAAYGQPLDRSRAPELAALVGNAFFCRAMARSMTKAVPVVGPLISGGMGFAATEAVGRAAIEYFEAGGNAAGLANVVTYAVGETTSAVRKASATPAGQAVIATVKCGLREAACALRGKQ